jgi:hypothetical protein
MPWHDEWPEEGVPPIDEEMAAEYTLYLNEIIKELKV